MTEILWPRASFSTHGRTSGLSSITRGRSLMVQRPRPDLRGGCAAMRIPTATEGRDSVTTPPTRPATGAGHGILEPNKRIQRGRRARAAAIRRKSRLDDYHENTISKLALWIPNEAPVVVMVNGFLFDPRVALSCELKDTDNPHGRILHFQALDKSEEIRHHTTGWPPHLGFEESDNGERRLAVAFGWYSQPGRATSLISHGDNFYARV